MSAGFGFFFGVPIGLGLGVVLRRSWRKAAVVGLVLGVGFGATLGLFFTGVKISKLPSPPANERNWKTLIEHMKQINLSGAPRSVTNY